MDNMMSENDKQVGGSHYKSMTISPWDIIDTWPVSAQVAYHKGNILKYILREKSGNDAIEELQKAAHHLNKLIEVMGHHGCIKL